MGAGNTKEKKGGASSGDTEKSTSEMIEQVVCKEDDVKENEMKAFEIPDAGKVLVVKQGGVLYAVGNKCSHYGAPLHTGVLGEGRVRCPWHGACFSISTGDIEEFPGLDSLPCFKVKVENGDVKVCATREQLAVSKRIKSMAARDAKDKRTFLVVGGGAAGACCVETLRQDGFQGRLVMVTKEPALPYDRIKLSKALDTSVEKLLLRSESFYKENDIEVLTSTELMSLDTEGKVAHLSSGAQINYNSVFLATGSTPNTLSVPGAELKNVFVLRDVKQANEIANQLDKEKCVVILGASFIGMEVAAYCISKAKSVTVVLKDTVPFKPVLGELVGRRLMELHREKGVVFMTDNSIVELIPKSDAKDTLNSVKLSDGSVVPADVLVLGIGARPNTGFLSKSKDVQLTAGGAIIVNKNLQTDVSGVFAGGDIAHAPVFDTMASIGHWQLAHYHGRVAARNMLGLAMQLNTVPFFWTMLFGTSIRYTGYGADFDDIVMLGNLAELKFVAFYCKGKEVLAVATCGSDPIAAKFAERLASGNRPSREEIETNPDAWSK